MGIQNYEVSRNYWNNREDRPKDRESWEQDLGRGRQATGRIQAGGAWEGQPEHNNGTQTPTNQCLNSRCIFSGPITYENNCFQDSGEWLVLKVSVERDLFKQKKPSVC